MKLITLNELKLLKREKAVLLVKTPKGSSEYVAIWFSDNKAIMPNCDAYIGYTQYIKETSDVYSEIDGGEMDYNVANKKYSDISDTIKDIINFIYNSNEASISYQITDLDEIE